VALNGNPGYQTLWNARNVREGYQNKEGRKMEKKKRSMRVNVDGHLHDEVQAEEDLKQMHKQYGAQWILDRVEQTMQWDVLAADSPNFKEVASVEEANSVDLEIYRLLSYSDRQGKYVFCKRSRK
jgi:hypothetical protein